MKYIKSYEHTTKDEATNPQIGNYCITNTPVVNKEVQDFFLNNIGKIRRIQKSIPAGDPDNEFDVEIYDDDGVFVIDYENIIPWSNYDHSKLENHKHNHTFLFYKNEILFSSKNKNICEIFIQTNKYNL